MILYRGVLSNKSEQTTDSNLGIENSQGNPYYKIIIINLFYDKITLIISKK